MDTILHNENVWFTDDGRLEIYNSRLATKINKYLKTYDNGNYVFSDGEEACFRVPSDQIQTILLTFLTRNRTIND